MKTKEEIVENWLPRYTGTHLDEFGQYIILVNFNAYVELFAEWNNVPIKGHDRPMTRGQSFAMKATGSLEKAESLNSENPRIYFLKAQNALYTPQMFGGGKVAAKPLFEMAKTKFQNFKPANELSPDWGKEQNEKLLASCN